MVLTLPFFAELLHARRILLAGMGGGFDVFCALPLYFALQQAGKEVFLANLSFSFLPPTEEQRLSPALLRVTADTPCYTDYFPEYHLARWFRAQGEEVPIYCFERQGVQPLLASYRTLRHDLDLDTVILVDGGTDSLMRGDEVSLSTPHEDASSIVAVNELEVERKLMVCLGFGVDYHHGICHFDFLAAVAELTRHGGYLGMFSLLETMPEVQRYRAASEAVFKAMPRDVSIVSSSILSALAGHYGDHHATARTHGSALWINPLMPVYWCFYLGPVAQRLLYREALKSTESYMEVRQVINAFRHTTPLRPRREIPV